MIRSLLYRAVLPALLAGACRPDREAERLVSQIDSLNGALSVYQEIINEQDSLFLSEALARYETYRVFIKYRNEDTLRAEEARSVENFFRNARQLESCRNKEPLLLKRCSLLCAQLGHLKHDIQEQSILPGQAQEHLKRETEAAKDLGQVILQHARLRQQAALGYSENRPPVEAYLRSKNDGKLPLNITPASAN